MIHGSWQEYWFLHHHWYGLRTELSRIWLSYLVFICLCTYKNLLSYTEILNIFPSLNLLHSTTMKCDSKNILRRNFSIGNPIYNVSSVSTFLTKSLTCLIYVSSIWFRFEPVKAPNPFSEQKELVSLVPPLLSSTRVFRSVPE